MRRRDLLIFVVSAAVTPHRSARAQRRSSPLVAFLSPRTAETNVGAFRRGLRELGYIEGQNITVVTRSADGDNRRLPGLAAELAALKPDVIVTNGGPCQALVVMSDPLFVNARRQLIDPSGQHRIAASYDNKLIVDTGGLMSYGPDTVDMFRRSAAYVDKILRGEKPADLPIEQPTKFELVINMKTAKALGLTVPPALLARADEVIE